MSKTLAVSTIKKALRQIGFQERRDLSANEIRMCFVQFGQTISVTREPNSGTNTNIVFSNARWTEAPNVHIVSYFRFPRTGAELARMLSEVERIYGTLCGCRFEKKK